MFRHALCIHPYRVELGPWHLCYPPLGLEIIATMLEPYCHSIDVIDLRHESKRTEDFLRSDTDRVGAICDLLLEREVRKRYLLNARIEIARRPDVLMKMADVGFVGLGFGIESAQDKTLRSMRKGFTTTQVREYFRVIRRSRMILHGCFIVGNIGENEREMLEIARFARELGLDSISAKLLRSERYSALEDLVAQSPGYHIAQDGIVFSDLHSPDDLRRIRDRIVRRFYSTQQLLRIGGKVLRNHLFRPRMLASVPRFLLNGLRGRFNPEERKGMEAGHLCRSG